ncbi:MAG: hypothetical protein ABFR62_06015 [Bacteroidota bacterium]
MKNRNILFTIAFTLLFSFSSFGGNKKTKIKKRFFQQKEQIERGIRKGSITRQEAKKLFKQQKHIKKSIRIAKSDGFVTKRERMRIHNMQNRASNSIYAMKHNNKRRGRRGNYNENIISYKYLNNKARSQKIVLSIHI